MTRIIHPSKDIDKKTVKAITELIEVGNKFMENPTLVMFPVSAKTAETDKAVCFELEGQSVWIPKSQIRDMQEAGDDYSFYIPEWMVQEKDLEEFAVN